MGAVLSQNLDYDVATGHLDYVIRAYSDRQEAVDYNAGTGFADFSVTSFKDGRTTVLDYEGTTGRLAYRLETNSSGQYVATSYDLASGAADYVIQSNLDGRQVSTDYDVANTQDWASFSLSYKLTGLPNRPTESIPNVTILYDDGRKYVFEQDYRPAPLSVPGESRSMLFNPQGVLEYVTIRDGAGNRQEVDYDGSSGQIDYLVSHWADGRMTATDYDLADQFAWNSYTVNYDAFGNVQSVTTT
ncbi:YD repeat-containing protein [Roseomonas rosea]|uniref:YD repeat-containing protein n=1 Tax=Muricoccus roseus TaxID=198092 RepID=A0A1M6C257_9PROT|nr:hypothetical protein [Roseomonas rosea]SHI54788.1 YD repeat-containing protein [Roseomonas rosea]